MAPHPTHSPSDTSALSLSTAPAAQGPSPILARIQREFEGRLDQAFFAPSCSTQNEGLTICDIPSFYAHARSATYLDNWERNSFLMPGKESAVYTDLIGGCSVIGISNANEPLLCHFRVGAFDKHRDEILKELDHRIGYLTSEGSGPVRGFVISGNIENGLAIANLLGERGVRTLALIGQNHHYQAGLAYTPSVGWCLNIHQRWREDEGPIDFLAHDTSVLDEARVEGVFKEVHRLNYGRDLSP